MLFKPQRISLEAQRVSFERSRFLNAAIPLYLCRDTKQVVAI